MIRKIFISVAIIFLLLVTGVGWYFSSLIIHPEKGPCDKKHFIHCGTPESLKLPFEEVTFTASDGLALKAWYIPSYRKEAVIMIHGHGADRHEALRWVRALNRGGLCLLIPDLRNHGKSSGAMTTMGYYEKRDVNGALLWLRQVKKKDRVGVFGVSMGAATAVMAMADNKDLRAGVFEAGYSSLRRQLEDIAKRDYGLPSFPLMNMVSLFFRARTGVPLDAVAPEKEIGKISPRSVLVIHCPGDDYIHFSHGQRLFEAAGQPKDFWASPCTTHAEAWQGDPAEAESRVTSFFIKNLR